MMIENHGHTIAVAMAAPLACVAPAPAQVTVAPYQGTGTFTGSAVEVDGKWNVSITAAGLPHSLDPNGEDFRIRVVANSDAVIRWLYVESNRYDSDPDSAVFLEIRGNGPHLLGVEEVSRVSNDALPDGAVWIESLNTGGTSAGTANLGPAGTILGGGVRVHGIRSLGIDGNITAPITILAPPSGSSMTSPFIDNVLTTGALLNGVSNLHGEIRRLSIGSTIGTAAPGGGVWISARSGIRYICGTDVYATIAANAAGGSGDLQNLAIAGRFVGSLFANNLNVIDNPLSTGISVGQDFIANATFAGDVLLPLTMSTLAKGRTIKMASLLAGMEIGQTAGLEGQVIINVNNDDHTWHSQAFVSVGGVMLANHPFYDQPASSLGGGSAGLARFGLHGSSCDPPHGATTGGVKHVRLSHYGALGAPAGSGKPVVVTFFPAAGGSIDVTNEVDVFMFPDGVLRDLLLVPNNNTPSTPVFATPGAYVVQPVLTGLNALRCADVAGSPPVLDWTYTFDVE